MKKKNYRSKKVLQKRRETIFIGALAVLLVVALILGVIDIFDGDNGSGYTVTEDGHVHASDGTHIGTVEEIFGEGAVVTGDGHVHSADGDHIGDLNDIIFTEDAHDHTEDAHDHAEDEAAGADEAADAETASEEAADAEEASAEETKAE